jgi:hypothetical protein
MLLTEIICLKSSDEEAYNKELRLYTHTPKLSIERIYLYKPIPDNTLEELYLYTHSQLEASLRNFTFIPIA